MMPFMCTEQNPSSTAQFYFVVNTGGSKVNGNKGKTHTGGGTWKKEVFGLQLWIWIAVGASSVVLIVLIIVTVLVRQRNKRMKVRERKEESQHACKIRSGSFFFLLSRREWKSWDPCGSPLQPKTTANATGTSSSFTLCNTVKLVLLTVKLTKSLYGLYIALKG